MIGLDTAIAAVIAERAYAEVELTRSYQRVRELDATIAALKRLRSSSASTASEGSPPIPPAEEPDAVDCSPVVDVVTQEAPASTASAPAPPTPDAQGGYGCDQCVAWFGTKHGLLVHQARKHKVDDKPRFDPDEARARAADAAFGDPTMNGVKGIKL